MAKGNYVFKDGKFIPKSEVQTEKKHFHSVIVDEIAPTEHPKTGQIITSKKKFRKISQSYGLEECYGEDEKYWQKETVDEEKDIQEDVEKSIAQLSYGEGLTDEARELCIMRDQMEEWERD